MANVLDIRNLSIDFETPRGHVHALRDVSFSVPEKSTVGIVGESGCGKTTVISAAMRLLADNADVVSGEVIFEGQDILKLSPAELRALRGERISMVF
ncbi:MAG: ATP-binding cassette domain-containing protein, partial [Alphaproteobacteria bacterium]